MKIITIIADPEFKKQPLIIDQDGGPDTPAVIIPPNRETPKDTAPPKPEEKPKPS